MDLFWLLFFLLFFPFFFLLSPTSPVLMPVCVCGKLIALAALMMSSHGLK
jgi:hypothetical protein